MAWYVMAWVLVIYVLALALPFFSAEPDVPALALPFFSAEPETISTEKGVLSAKGLRVVVKLCGHR